MNFKSLFLSLLMASPFSLSLTANKHYGYTYDSEYKDYSVAGKGSVSYELKEMGYNLYEFNDDYQKDEELITCTETFDSDNLLHTYVYIFTKDVTIEYVDITISTSLERDEQGNYDENPRSYPLYLVSYNIDNTLRKYEIMDLSLNTYIRRLAVSKINSLKLSNSNKKEYSIINVSMVYLFKGLNNDELECFYEGLDTLIITDHVMGTFLYGLTYKDSFIPSGYNTFTDCWYYFFNTNISMDKIIDLDIEYTKYSYMINGVIDVNVVPTKTYIENSILNNGEEVRMADLGQGVLESKPWFYVLNDGIPVNSTISNEMVEEINDSYWWDFFKLFSITKSIEKIIDLNSYNHNEYLNFDFCDFSKYRWGVEFLTTNRVYGKDRNKLLYDDFTMGEIPVGASILRIKFIKDGVVYNMNVVDTRVDASFAIDATTSFFSQNIDLIVILIIILCILVIGAIASVITPIKNVVVIVIKYTWKAIVFVFKLITWPIKFLFTGDKSFW
ncbi:MAG: hypothetical protein ACI311_06780 [Bacilli bacterium]